MTATATRSERGRQLWAQDRDHVLHPWATLSDFDEKGALVIDRGEGAHVWDADGRRYLDAMGGLWCTNIGLGREEVAQAIAEQARRLAFANHFVDVSNTRASELAARLAGLAPDHIDHMMFTTGGSTAVDTAYRLVRFYQYTRGKPEKRHVIVRRQGYHGSTYLTASLTGKDQIPEFEYLRDGIHFVTCPNPYRAPEGMDEAAFCDFLVEEIERKILDLGPENVAAFFAEPILGAGGVIVPPDGYNRRTWELCRRYDILYVADEVVTAFGRLGAWFASSKVFGIQPDIICCAKGLTSGYVPLGACLYSREIHQAMLEAPPGTFFGHGFTYAGHPVACAAALKVIEILERERLLDHVNNVGPYFERRLHELEDMPLVGNVRGHKLMMCLEYVADKETKALFPEELNIGKRIADKCEELGLIVRPIVHLNIMSPPLVIGREEVDFIVDTLRRATSIVADELVREGLWRG